MVELIGAPGVTRTRGTRIRNPLLYPPELQGHWLSIYNLAIFASMKNFKTPSDSRQDFLKGNNGAREAVGPASSRSFVVPRLRFPNNMSLP